MRAIAILALAAALTACGGASRDPAVAHDAAALFDNGGFEAGDLSSWSVSVYWNNGIANYPPQSLDDLGLEACPSTAHADCVNLTTVMTSAAPESQQISGPPMGTVSLASPRWPKFGRSSAVVNYGGFRRNVNSLKQQYTTTASDVDPSDGTIHARFALSPQLQNPGHPAAQQPYFYVVLRNLTKGTTLYQTFNYSNQVGIPWQSYTPGSPGAPSAPPWGNSGTLDVTTAPTYANSPVLYTDWQVFDVAPGNAALWIGDTIEIQVVAAGCSPAGHWGQVWVDGFGAMLPSLSIAGTAPQWVPANTDLTYTFTVENATSLVARNVVATEVLPANTTFVSMVQPTGLTTTTPCTVPAVGAAGTGITGGPQVVCPLGWLNPSTSVRYQVTVHTAAGLPVNTVITNGNYSVQGDGIHSILGAKIETQIGSGPYADLGVTVTDGVPAVVPGGPVTYTIVATNFGPTPVSTVTLADAFPAQLQGVTWTCAGAGGGACSKTSGSGSIDPTNGGTVSLPSGATATFTVSATVDPAATGTLANTATVSLPGGITDSNPSNNSDTDLDTIGVVHAIAVSKAPSATGQGQVISSPVGISCGVACSSQSVEFLDGSQVTLTAIARPGDWFAGWTGACIGSGNVCTITLAGADLSVVAEFRGPAVVGSTFGGGGTVSCAPSPVAQHTSSTCTITPASGYQLVALTDNGVDVLAQVSAGSYTISGAALVNDHAVIATFLKSQGTGCGAAGECTTGFCVDGVCCDGACGGQCQACNAAGSVGTCSPAPRGSAPAGSRPQCTANYPSCAGSCDGVTTSSCTYPGAATSCAQQSCTNGVQSGGTGATCDGAGSCNSTATSCAPYVCGPAAACLSACSSDGQCQAGSYCSGGRCVAQETEGQACTSVDQCQSGNCVDGYCCDTACNGQCEACGLPGLHGTCSPVTGNPVGVGTTRVACVSDGSACGGTCDGTRRDGCAYPADGISCRAGSCTAGVATLAASCNGSGTCPATQTQACSPLVCGASACTGPGACLSDPDCPSGDWCSGGVCVAKLGAGGTCGADAQCGTGHCVDGVCCDTACNGQCEACDVSGHAGTCTPVSGAPVGARRACESDGSSCGGTCDGTVRTACTYPGTGASCRGASCAGGVATLAASCDGAGRCPAIQTVACAPNTCSGTTCGGGCSVDADCGSSGLWCEGGVCVAKLGAGAACSGDGQCGTGHCADGVCCDTACNGQCEACAQPGSVGTCSPTAGEPVGARPACGGDGSACGGTCDGTNRSQCGYPSTSVQCRAPSCAGGVSTVVSTCDGAGSCPAPQRLTCPGGATCAAGVETLAPSCNGVACAPLQTQACGAYVCDASACFTSCSADGQCQAGSWCSGTTSTCVPQKADGAACGGTDQCQSGHCVDGFCCDSACNGQCEACGLPGLHGTCSPVTGAPLSPRVACASDGSACGGACDGARRTTCTYPGDGVSCRAPACTAGTATLAAACDGQGSCPAPQQQACTPLVCGPSACSGPGACSSDSDCPAGDWCAGGECIAKRSNGTACGADDQCGTGHCVDGVCCDGACNGQCEACDASGHAGTCTPVSGAPVGTRIACESDGSSCGGACDGTLRTACTYPGASTSCRAASCAAGIATLGASCDGAGSCPAAQTVPCAPHTCSGTSCGGGCASDADCPGGRCAGGVCQPKLAPGAACAGDAQCATGHCVDGVCCDTACNGQCEACAIPGSVGTCTPQVGAPAGARPACVDDGSACGGACDGSDRTACVYPSSAVSCRAGSCAGGVATLATTCDGEGSCPPVQHQTCAPYLCGATGCAGDCTVDPDCVPTTTQWCSGGVCVPRQGTGSVCSGDAQCASGHCVHGACTFAPSAKKPGDFELAGGGCSSTGTGSLAPLGALALALLRRRRRDRRARLLAALLLLAPAATRADGKTIDVQRFDPLGGANDVLAVPSARVSGDLELHAALLTDYGARPLRLLDKASGGSTDLVQGMTTGTATASLGLLGWAELSAALPFELGGSGTSGSTVDPALPSAAPTGGLGDLRLTPKVTFAPAGTSVALALVVPVTLPTGTSPYLSGSTTAVSPRAAVELGTLRGARLAMDVGATLQRSSSFGGLQIGSELVYGLAAELPFASGRISALGTLSGAVGGSKDHPLEALAALRFRGPAGLAVTIGGGPGLSQSYGTPQYRVVAAVELGTSRLASGPEPDAAEPIASASAVAARPASAGSDRAPGAQPAVAVAAPARPATKGAAPAPQKRTAYVEPKAVLKVDRIAIHEPVQFVPGRDDVAPSSSQLLDDVAAVLRTHPEISVLRIEVHTDDDGNPGQLLAQSRRRAAKVREQLEKRGVGYTRLDARGYGDTQPVTTNYSERDRAMNRRVEFVVAKKAPAPAAAPR
jgi:uncharacterized repeat protein (TIGR01451 family)/uncharacterized protein (TIGR03382 family)